LKANVSSTDLKANFSSTDLKANVSSTNLKANVSSNILKNDGVSSKNAIVKTFQPLEVGDDLKSQSQTISEVHDANQEKVSEIKVSTNVSQNIKLQN
jgi:hypothetical protein